MPRFESWPERLRWDWEIDGNIRELELVPVALVVEHEDTADLRCGSVDVRGDEEERTHLLLMYDGWPSATVRWFTAT
jgi:hypothetical protein